MKSERGAALILALWTITLLSMLAIGLAYRVSIELRLTKYQLEDLQMIQMAKAALVLSQDLIDAKASVHALNQEWSHNKKQLSAMPLMGGVATWSRANPSGNPGDPVLYGLSDEESRININIAGIGLMTRIPGIDRSLAEAIVDWRDANTVPTVSGGEEYDGYAPRNGMFRSVDELLLVKGMTRERFLKARPFLCAHGSGRVNVNTASAGVLEALGMSEGLVSQIMLYRKGEDMILGTKDDGVFTNTRRIFPELLGSSSLAMEDFKTLSRLAPTLTVRSTWFQMGLTVRRGKYSRRYHAIFSENGGGRPVYWNERA